MSLKEQMAQALDNGNSSTEYLYVETGNVCLYLDVFLLLIFYENEYLSRYKKITSFYHKAVHIKIA